ncbi:MAG: hypothetical protein PUA61_02840 [Succinatimonas hippei]|nr:hypothetical protein [Succinatimonas hippei]
MLDASATAMTAGMMCAAGAFCCACAAAALLPSRKERRAFPYLLDYSSLEKDGVVALKTGALMSVFECFPPDLGDLRESERDLLRSRLAALFLRCDADTVIASDVVRDCVVPRVLPYEGPEGTALLEKARDKHLTNLSFFHNRFYICFIKKNATSAPLPDQSPETFKADELSKDLKLFLKNRDAFYDSLSLCYPCSLLGGTKAKDQELLSFLSRCVLSRSRPVAVPDNRQSLDALLSSEDFVPGLSPMIGPMRVACVCLDLYPADTVSCALERLLSLPFALRISARCLSYDQMKSDLIMRRRRRIFEQRRHGFLNQIFNVDGGHVNSDAQKQADDVNAAVDSLNSRDEAFGALSYAVIIGAYNMTDLDERVRACVRAIEECGFGARVETINATECYLGSLPGNFRANIRRPLVSNSVLADLLPFCGTSRGEDQSPNRGYKNRAPLMQLRARRGELFSLNLHSEDLGNTIVIGPPGSGKSVLLNALINSLLRYRGMRVWAFERGLSLYALCHCANGTHTTLDGGARLCPLKDLETPEALNRASDFIMNLCCMENSDKRASDEKAIRDALQLLSEKSVNTRTLSDFSMLCESKAVRLAIKPWLKGNGGGGILDGDDDPSLEASLCVFECGGLFSRKRECAMVLRHLLGRIGRICESDDNPGAIVLDEAWIMLKDEVFREDLISWLKTLRKHNTLVIISSQSLSDLDEGGHADALLDCAKTRIFLPNPDALGDLMAHRYEKAGLNANEISDVARGVPRRDLFLKKDGHFSRLNLALSEEELEIYSLSGVSAITRCHRTDKKIPQRILNGAPADQERLIQRTQKNDERNARLPSL